MKRETLPVIFRAERSGEHKGEVTAFFPTLPGTRDRWTVTCYAHVGQHGSACIEYYRTTRAATPEEFGELLGELARIYQTGDDAVTLKIANRWTRHHDAVRFASLKGN